MDWHKALNFLRVQRKPDFLIIGTTKGGTTAIYSYLRNHPGMISSLQKELNFFSRDQLYNQGFDYYHSLFMRDMFWRHKPCFEASPQYMFLPWTAERIFRYNPQMKLLVFLRNPVDRAYSQWNMHMQIIDKTLESDLQNAATNNPEVFEAFKKMYEMPSFRDFDKLVRELAEMYHQNPEMLEPSILTRGMYARQLKPYLELFPREQMLILESDYCKKNAFAVLDRICDFVHAPRLDWSRVQLSKRASHQRDYEQKMSAESRQFLQNFYAPANEELFQLLGKTYDWK